VNFYWKFEDSAGYILEFSHLLDYNNWEKQKRGTQTEYTFQHLFKSIEIVANRCHKNLKSTNINMQMSKMQIAAAGTDRDKIQGSPERSAHEALCSENVIRILFKMTGHYTVLHNLSPSRASYPCC
jgi:hypothetical protein